ncbi:hypothetical protein KEM54_004782 [Ascosphaera aggregata]|nr:hypothetical protein KEM54_004782 [Ascosphaera aggregata]
MCFARSMIPPNVGMDKPARFYQLPFIRLVGQGNAWVAVFFMLLGYVNVLKPIQSSRAGKPADTLWNLARSCFRRSGRLIFPAAAVTVICWMSCQIGLLELARRSDAFWLQETSPPPSKTWLAAIWDLSKELVRTWMYDGNKYDQPQWALKHLFLGSLFPDQFANQAAWSRRLENIGHHIFPTNANQGRYWPALGSNILCASILYSSSLRNLLSHRFCTWLGSNSFSIYLLHGILIRTVLTWITFGPKALLSPPTKAIYTSTDHTAAAVAAAAATRKSAVEPARIKPSGQWATPDLDIIAQPHALAFIFILPVFTAFLLFMSNLWTIHVEPYFGVATAWCERFATTWRKSADIELFEGAEEGDSRRPSRGGVESMKGSPRGSPRRSILPVTEKALR